ncbi:MAG TPA: ElyC/SanA/YdcF family protein [Terriglobia bacterium]|nr:ElyC/SanA/YdcF family protein [Terriglobia bacterium]
MPERKDSPSKAGGSWWRSSLVKLYENLTRDDAVRPVDLIFVMAGRMERKQYGLELFRAGVSPKLVLSIGRFEVSKMGDLDLKGIEELTLLRGQTPPDKRHFFMTLDSSGVRIEKAGLPVWNTYGEALALQQILEKEKARRVIVISNDIHLRRVALAIGKVFRRETVEIRYCPVPPLLMPYRKERWWTRPDNRRSVFVEMTKLAGYRLILSLPPRAALWIMRLQT